MNAIALAQLGKWAAICGSAVYIVDMLVTAKVI
jgi:hypothetical protein